MPEPSVEFRHSASSTSIPTDTVPIYQVDIENCEDQFRVYDKDNPSPNMFVAKNACTRNIPISALQKHQVDNNNDCDT